MQITNSAAAAISIINLMTGLPARSTTSPSREPAFGNHVSCGRTALHQIIAPKAITLRREIGPVLA
jgi:hypothetical protein